MGPFFLTTGTVTRPSLARRHRGYDKRQSINNHLFVPGDIGTFPYRLAKVTAFSERLRLRFSLRLPEISLSFSMPSRTAFSRVISRMGTFRRAGPVGDFLPNPIVCSLGFVIPPLRGDYPTRARARYRLRVLLEEGTNVERCKRSRHAPALVEESMSS